jgi:hypothetical protein
MITLDGYENAFIGFTERFTNNKFIAIYDRDKCIEITMHKRNLEKEDAIDWFEQNIDIMDKGEETPIIMFAMNYKKYLDLSEYLWGHHKHQNDN